MHIALKGFLLGLAIGALLVFAEYYVVKKAVADRATATNKNPKFDAQDKSRLRAVVNFALLLPPGFAVGAWLLERFMS